MFDPRDYYLIRQIAQRAATIYESVGKTAPWQYIASELTIVHEAVVPLRLNEMADGRDLDVIHDVAGIHRHLEIYPKPHLGSCFLPRFAKTQS